MKIYLLAAACLLFSLTAKAHNPLSAKFELEAMSSSITLFHVYLSQTGLHQAMLQHYEATNFTEITMEEYKRLAVGYVKEHVNMVADGITLVIGEGGIKLGSHETDFKFIVSNYPQTVKSLTVEINAFTENDHHVSVLWWKWAGEKTKLVLSESNDYRGTLGLISGSALLRAQIGDGFSWLWGLGAFVVGGVFLAIYAKHDHPKGGIGAGGFNTSLCQEKNFANQ